MLKYRTFCETYLAPYFERTFSFSLQLRPKENNKLTRRTKPSITTGSPLVVNDIIYVVIGRKKMARAMGL